MATDLVEKITGLLHDAYAPLLAQGLNFTATWQDSARTMKRLSGGTAFVGFVDCSPIATGLVLKKAPRAEGIPPWFLWEDVGIFAQFAVTPKLQRRGVGSELLKILEQEALSSGKRHLACDTAEAARELIAFYTKRGYEPIGYTQHPNATYRSVVLSKRLIEPDPSFAMSFLELRPANEGDRHFIEDVYFQTQRWLIERFFGWRGDDAEKAKFAEFYEPDETSIIVLNGEPIGWLAVRRTSAGFDLEHLYISPSHQSAGVGAFLIGELVREAGEAGVPLRAATAKINPARRLFERLGFVATGDDEYKIYLQYRGITRVSS
jgi:GNAT superfamily N-acetyltransferase